MQNQKKIKKYFLVLLRKIYPSFILLFIAIYSFSQANTGYYFRRITQEDGLLHNNVYDIVQDKRGFIWIATANGLQRYDGYRFLNFHDMLNDPLQSSSGIPSLYADNTGNALWINQVLNAEKMNLLNQKITFYTPDERLDSLSSLSEIYKDKNGDSYLVAGKFIFQYNSVRKKYEVLSQSVKPFKGICGNYVEDTFRKQVWMGSNVYGLTLFDAKTKGVYTASYNPVHNPVLKACRQQFGDSNVSIRRVMMDSYNNLWIATWGKWFYQYQAATGRMLSYSLSSLMPDTKNNKDNSSPQTVSCFYEDDHHIVWVSAENAGLFAYHPETDRFDYITINNKSGQSDPYNYNIFCIFQDHEENIWLGTDKGITLFNPYRQYFQYIHHDDNKPSLPKSEIESYIQTATGNILAGTWGGGITVFDSNWNFKKNIRFPDTSFELNLVWNFVQNDDGTIWAGCQHGYIHIYNPGDGSVCTIHPPELNNSTIRSVAKDNQGNIWFGLHNGKIAEWNQQQQRFYAYNSSDNKQPSSAPVTFVFFDKQQRCWVSTDGEGLKQFDTNKRQYLAASTSPGNAGNAFAYNTIKGIEQLTDTTLMVAILHGGIVLFSTLTNAITHFTPANDLRFSNCYAIKKEDGGDVWFTTDYGLYKWEAAGRKIIRYHFAAGMLNAAFKASSFYTLQNGKWATSTATEIITFSPRKKMIASPVNTKIEITGVSVFNQPVLVDSLLSANQPLHLTYTQNFLAIEFAKLSFTTVHQTDYYYRLQGVDNNWVYAGNQPFATYTNLAPGSYEFEVMGEDDTGATAVTSLSIIIDPPFWKTGWFLLLALLCMGCIVYLFMRWRIKNIREVEKEKLNVQAAKIETLSLKEKLLSAKLQALQSQMNPHFIFNCLNSIDNLIQTGEKEKATTYLAKFAKLIRSVLETSGSNTVPCWKDMETMKMYLEMEELRCDNQFIYHIRLSNEITDGDYKVPPLVIQPFVENAIHHGLLNKIEKDKELWIDVSVQNNYIHYTIQDNGVGRTKADEYKQLNKPSHHSMGVQISTDRIHLFNQNGNGAVVITDLYNAQQQAAGTRVEVNINNQP